MPNSPKTDIYNPYDPITFAGALRCGPQLDEESRQKAASKPAATPLPGKMGQRRRREDLEVDGGVSRNITSSASQPTTLTISSDTKLEDILKERTRQAAAMGVTRAIDMTKEEAAMKHKESLHMSSSASSSSADGTTTTRIADQVLKLKNSSVGVNLQTGEATLGGSAKPLPPSFSGDDASSTALSSTTLPPPSTKMLETHLEFQRGKDGKHVIAAAAPPGAGGVGFAVAPRVVVFGKPTSTLIIRNLILRDTFYGRPTTPDMPTPSLEQKARIATSFRDRIIAEVSAECGKCGHVKEIVVCDMYQSPPQSPPSSSNNNNNNNQHNNNAAVQSGPPPYYDYPIMPMLAPTSSPSEVPNISGDDWEDEIVVAPQSFKSQRDAIVVWVRMDTVVNGFKASGMINGKVFLGDPSRLAVVGFYPSNVFDQGIRTTNNAVLNRIANTSRVVLVEALEKLLPAEYLHR